MENAGGYITTHVLDTARGQPAAGLQIDVYRLADAQGSRRTHIARLTTNTDGRTDLPAIERSHMSEGIYELVFHAGAYLRHTHGQSDDPSFLDVIPVRFSIADSAQHYHVPLLLSPFGYTTYRGS